jgi:hypothetical protein
MEEGAEDLALPLLRRTVTRTDMPTAYGRRLRELLPYDESMSH